MNTRERNIIKIQELVPSKRWGVIGWMDECAEQGYEFRISEAYRTQERQKKLYAQGRTKPGRIVTHTLQSKHTERLAIDVYSAKGESDAKFYATIAMIAKKYGITHPYTVGFIDLPHFEVVNVPPRSIEPEGDRVIHNRRLLRLMDRLSTKPYKVVTRVLGRIKRHFPWFPL